jgi:hypothetical protein
MLLRCPSFDALLSQETVRFQLFRFFNGVDTTKRFAADFKVYLGLYKEPRDFPNRIAVIHNQDALRHRCLLQRVAFVAALVSPETVATIR